MEKRSSSLGMAVGQSGDEFRYPIPIPIENIHPHSQIQIQRVSNFCPIPTPTE